MEGPIFYFYDFLVTSLNYKFLLKCVKMGVGSDDYITAHEQTQ